MSASISTVRGSSSVEPAWTKFVRKSNRAIDLTDRQFDRLTVLGVAGTRGKWTLWACRCLCGRYKIASTVHLNNGSVRSCGCLQRDLAIGRAQAGLGAVKKTHGRSRTAIYRAYRVMVERCFSEACSNYERYGARGISVCPRWLGESGFINFLADMGERPFPGASVDRRDNDGDYTPENCRWASLSQQARNRRSGRWVTHNGRRILLIQLCEELGVDYRRAHKLHVSQKKPLDEVLTKLSAGSPSS